MTRKQKLITIIVSIAVAVVLLTTAVIAIVINAKKNNQATTIMTCDVNPKVQFVLNGNNKVMKVVALNDDGYAVSHYVEFIGLKAEDAAEMFVKISTEAGYINPTTNGTKVNIDINGKNKNYNKLKNKVTNKVNKYFDEHGIIAGAYTTITSDLKEAIKTLKPNALNLENKNNDELIQQFLDITTSLTDGISPSRFATLFDNYNGFHNDLTNQVTDIQTQIDETLVEIDEYKTQLASSSLSDAEKQIISATITQLENAIEYMKQDITRYELTFSNNVSRMIESARKSSASEFISLQNEITTRINTEKGKLLEHKATYAQNKADIDNKIAEYRATFNN